MPKWYEGIVQEWRDFTGAVISFPQDFFGVFGLPPAESGAIVNEMSSLQIAAYFTCVRVISDAVGTLPLNVMEYVFDDEGNPVGERVAFNHYLQPLLHDKPNQEVCAADQRQAGQSHCLMTGNTYIEIDWSNGGQVRGLYLRSCFSTFPYRNAKGDLIYKTHDEPNGGERIILSEDMIHVKGLGIDSLLGLSPIKYYAREVLGNDISAQAYSAKFFANNANPGGYLQAPGNLSDKQKLDSMRTWIDAHGRGNTHKPAVLEGGWKWEQTAINPEDAQLIETRKLNRSQICAIFGVPEHMAGGEEEKANMEQKTLEFLTFTIKPWLNKWEQAINAKLFPKVGRTANKYFVKFDTKSLERANYADMVKGLQMLRYAGGIDRDELRREMGYNPAKPDQKFLLPVNMQETSEDEPAPPPAAPPKGGIGGNAEPEPGGKPDETKSNSKLFLVNYPPFRDAFGRILTRKKPNEDDFLRVFKPVMVSIAAALDFKPDAEPGDLILSVEKCGFLIDYIKSMPLRAKDWKAEEADKQAAVELKRAIEYIEAKVKSELQES